jgi:hypothetical protein
MLRLVIQFDEEHDKEEVWDWKDQRFSKFVHLLVNCIVKCFSLFKLISTFEIINFKVLYM